MTWLDLILAVKIGVTGSIIAGPLLFLPTAKLAKRVRGGVDATALARLYGVAILALLVGYSSAFWTIARGDFPWGVVAMGLASNGGATLVLFSTGAWRGSKTTTLFLAAITVALAASALAPQSALGRI